MRFIESYIRAPRVSRGLDTAILLLLFGFSFFYGLGRMPLLNPDEARYAEIPREMIELGDYVTPRLNYVPYFDKPPLYYWLNALAFRVFGETEFAARFFGALSGLACVLLVRHIGGRVWGRREGLLSALILGTSIGYLEQSRLVIIDTPLALLMTATLGSFLLASRRDEPRKGFYRLSFFLCMGLAALAKGPIAIVLPSAIIGAWLLLARRWRLLRELRFSVGIPVFLLIAVPWFVLVSIRNPVFPWYFFIHEHLIRFFTTEHGRYEPFWFFLPVLFGCMFPWSCFFPSAAVKTARGGLRGDDGAGLFLGLWAAVIFCFFSLSGSKLVPYILPMFPAAALLTGRLFASSFDDGFRPVRRGAWFLGVLFPAGVAAVLLYPFVFRAPYFGFGAAAVYAILVPFEALFVILAIRRSSAAGLFLGLCAMTYAEGVIGPPFILDTILRERSLRELASLVRDRARPGDPVLCYGHYAHDLSFYLKRRIVCVDVPRELELGSTQGDQSAWFLDFPAFYRLCDTRGPLFVFIEDEKDLALFARSVRTPIRTLGRKGDSLIVSNR